MIRDWFRERGEMIRHRDTAIQNAINYRVASEANFQELQNVRSDLRQTQASLDLFKKNFHESAASVETWKALAEKWEKQSAQNLIDWHKEKRSNAALHGVITRMKNGGKNGR